MPFPTLLRFDRWPRARSAHRAEIRRQPCSRWIARSVHSEKVGGLRSCGFLESEQPVTVMLVLLTTRLDLGGQAERNIAYQRVKFIEDSNDALLFFERRNGNTNLGKAVD